MLIEFAELLEKHIRFEERTVFKFFQESLDEKQLHEIFQIHQTPVKEPRRTLYGQIPFGNNLI